MINSFQLYIEQLSQRFLKPLPGEVVQFKMAHVARPHVNWKELNSNKYKISAVLIFIFPNENNQPTFLIIQRPTYNGYHSAQIGLPGGKLEPNDENEEATALREFKEETGCSETPIIIGKCTPVYIPVSNFVVHPFVGYLNHKPVFNKDDREVELLIECTIETLLNPSIIKETIINQMPHASFKTPYFDVENKIVWGATAMILNEFKEIIKNSMR